MTEEEIKLVRRTLGEIADKLTDERIERTFEGSYLLARLRLQIALTNLKKEIHNSIAAYAIELNRTFCRIGKWIKNK